MVSIVVPTYNRQECLIDMLQSLRNQTFQDFEVLVIDQSEIVLNEKIQQILGSCPKIRYFHVDCKGRSVAKNFAIDKALGDVVIFCDDDIIVAGNFIEVHAELHKIRPEVGAISCHLIEPGEEEISHQLPLDIRFYGRFINKPNAIFDGYVYSLNGGNMSFKKHILQTVGYFDENLIGTSMLEEPDIAYRVLKTGNRIYFSVATKVLHFPQKNGNVNTQRLQRSKWLSNYFFNQFYFLFRNRRVIFFPFVLVYLLYRSVVETFKPGMISMNLFLLPFFCSWQAWRVWHKKKQSYPGKWYTPRTISVNILKNY
jgi:glycosyltransferase involved in cell wall biosynthesis